MINELISDLCENARYVEGGREYPELDCYGVAIYVREMLGMRRLPELTGAVKEGGNINAYGKPTAVMMRGTNAEHGAVAACYDEHGNMTHTGIVVDSGGLCVVESNPVHNVTCMPLSRFKRRFFEVKYYGW